MLVCFTNWPWYFVGISLELIDLSTNEFPILVCHLLKYPVKRQIIFQCWFAPSTGLGILLVFYWN